MSAPDPSLDVILASASSVRADLLRHAGVPIATTTAGVDEDALKAGLLSEAVSPRDIADALAEAKSVKVSRKRQGLVIGADSTLEFDGRLFDKPKTLDEAREHLQRFRSASHKLHSAAVISEGGHAVWRHVASATLTMRSFSADFLEHYIQAEGDALLTSVGGYRLEGLGAQLFSRIDGDYFAILGLPLLQVLDFLRIRSAIQS